MYKIGDVVIINFSPSKGKEINKNRPALILSNDIINNNSPFCIVAPITSNTISILFTQFLLPKSVYNFLDNDSKVILEQLKSIDRTRISKKLGTISEKDIGLIKEKLKFCFYM